MGLCCCIQALFSCGERELCFVAVRQFLFVMASLVAQAPESSRGFSSCSVQTLGVVVQGLRCPTTCKISPD